MDRANEIVALLAAMKRRGYVDGAAVSVLASLADEDPATRGFSDETLIFAHMSLFSGDPEHLPLAIGLADRAGRPDLLELLLEIEDNYREPEVDTPLYRPENVDERFREHCRRRGITILRQLQAKVDGRESRRSVFLALDADGLVKVFKELRPSWASRLGLIDDESELYERLGPVPGLPRYYGKTVIDDDLTFLRMGVCYGRGLEDLGAPLEREEADYVVGRLAGVLAKLHAAGVVYNDLRLSNVKVDCDQVHLLDIGDAQFLDEDGEVATYVHGSRHVAPEVVLRHKAQPASDVFQLGVVYFELLAGRHPFSDGLPNEEDHDLSRLRDCLANVMLPASDRDSDLLARMLDAVPARRPSAVEIAEKLGGRPPRARVRRAPVEANGTVLFPARIGIPHRGHVDFIARLMELGYDVLVELGASYVLTPLDPLPKWMVLKMIGRSLEIRGLDTKRVSFACAPLFDGLERAGLHYELMPGVERVVAVASGNKEVHDLFAGRWPIIDQAALFAIEGEKYETRSWGARLREAVQLGDRSVFDELIAPGAEEIMNLDEMRSYYSRRPAALPLVADRGRAIAVLRDKADTTLVRQRVSAYGTPEDVIVQGIGATFVSRFDRHSVVRSEVGTFALVFEGTALEGPNLSINYRLENAA